MKDAILEILLDKVKATAHDFYPTGIEGLPQSAREIAELVTAFIKWLIDEQEIFLGDLSERYITKDNIVVDGKKSLTLDELFTYWKANVYKKQ